MGDEKTGAPLAPSKRTKLTITDELAKARGRLHELQPQVEAEAERLRRFTGRLERAVNRWKIEHPDEPFDADAHEPPMRFVPKAGADETQREFHRLHYVIEELEDELKALTERKPGPKP